MSAMARSPASLWRRRTIWSLRRPMHSSTEGLLSGALEWQAVLLFNAIRQQTPCETKFVAIGVNEVEEALTPFGIAGRVHWLQSRCAGSVVKDVNISNVEDCPAPPRPAPLIRLGDEIQIARPCSK